MAKEKTAQEEPSKPIEGLNIELFAVDEKKEVGGAWFPVASEVDFLVARWQNTEYLREMAKLYRENRTAIERGLMEDDEADEAMCRILAKTLFKGFRGPFLLKGEPIKDTLDKRVWILKNYREIRRFVVDRSQEVDAYRAEDLADAGKGS